MKLRTLTAALFIAATLLPAAAKKNVNDIAASVSDEAIIYPESFETDTRKLLEGWYMKNYTMTDDSYTARTDPGATDDQIRQRLADLPTIIEMPYSPIVKTCIERYTKKGRNLVASQLGLSNYYMPIFEQALEKYGLPLELKYLPVIESALDPSATSRAGAAGLWQFMISAAKGYDMEVNSLVDERRDPYVSSDRAARLLKDLYNTYGDWSLAIAAYNCGPGTVNKAIRRAGGDPAQHNFWTIYNYLPSETRGYFPMFIAANYVMNYYRDHDISPVLPTKPLITDTIAVNRRLHLDQVSKVLDIPMDELRVLNPQFRADIIPGTASKAYYLILPNQQIHAYIMSEDAIANYNLEKYGRHLTAMPGEGTGNEADNLVAQDAETFTDIDNEPAIAQRPDDAEYELEPNAPPANPITRNVAATTTTASTTNSGVIMHKVGAEESLASIARKYNVDPQQIKEWNSLRRNAVRTGQQLKIYTSAKAEKRKSAPAEPASSYTPASTRQTATATTKSTSKKSKNNEINERQQSKKTKDSKKSKKKTPARPKNHEIKDGENLTTIAKKYGTTVDALKKANNMKDDNLRAGRDLKIPASAKGEAKSSKKSGKKGSAKNAETKSSKKSGKKSSASKSSSKKKKSKKK